MDYFPLFISLRDKTCLVVGAGQVAFRKVSSLLEFGAKVRVVAPATNSEILELAKSNKIELILDEFDPAYVENMSLVIAATPFKNVNKMVAQACNKKNIPVNVVDTPELCSFIFPAIVDRNPMTIAVCSNGVAPVLARLIRARIEAILPQSIGFLGQLGKKYRSAVKAKINDINSRRRFWENIFEGQVSELASKGDEEAAESLFLQQLDDTRSHSGQGEVYLVGAGPGDPELLTFKALRLMQQADIVLYDRLVSPQILALTRRDAEKLYVGKQASNHCVPQDQINAKLIELAKQGHRVVRLKGGDPFIFGRGGEEAQALVAAGIPFTAVPGITSAAGSATYCGIPLTHRDYAQSVTFVTGHLKNNQCEMDWQAYAKPNQTLVIYMGLSNLQHICNQLIAHGKDKATPIALVENATRPEQRITCGTLDNITEKAKAAQVKSPALIIIGEVVSLHGQLGHAEKASDKQTLNFALSAFQQEHVA